MSSQVRVALLHFTKQLKDIKVDRMIKQTVALIGLTLCIGANAASIEYSLSGDLSGGFWYEEGVGFSNVSIQAFLGSYSHLDGDASLVDITLGISDGPIQQSIIFGAFSPALSAQAPSILDFEECNIQYRFCGTVISGSAIATPSAVPLPAAAWLFISAIAGLAGAKRLSRSKGSA